MLRAVNNNRLADVSIREYANVRVLSLHSILSIYLSVRGTLTARGLRPAQPIIYPTVLPVGHVCPASVGNLVAVDYVSHCFSTSFGSVSPLASALF